MIKNSTNRNIECMDCRRSQVDRDTRRRWDPRCRARPFRRPRWNNRISVERHSRDKDFHLCPDCKRIWIPAGRTRSARSSRKVDRIEAVEWLLKKHFISFAYYFSSRDSEKKTVARQNVNVTHVACRVDRDCRRNRGCKRTCSSTDRTWRRYHRPHPRSAVCNVR